MPSRREGILSMIFIGGGGKGWSLHEKQSVVHRMIVFQGNQLP